MGIRTAISCGILLWRFLFRNQPDGAAAEAISFRNDYLGICQEVYQYEEAGKHMHLVPKLRQELKAFAQTRFTDLKDHRFFS